LAVSVPQRFFWALGLLLLSGWVLAQEASVAARLADVSEVRRRLGVLPEYQHVDASRLKIAVLDFGFEGLQEKRAYLPASAELVEHYDPAFVRRHQLGDPEFRRPFVPGNSHGRQMAQIVWAVTGHRPEGPKFFLLNANGPTMFRRAVRYAIEQRVDVVLFCGVFEGGGNGDGRGFINRVVSEATDAGIIWINAAGNFGRRTFEGPLQVAPGGEVRFPGAANPTMLRFRNRLDENTVTVTPTWNDYRDQEDAGTDKDLDLYVYQTTGRLVAASELRQVNNRPAGEQESRNPRERLVLRDLPADEYWIKVRTKTPTAFGPADKLRVLITAERPEAAHPKTGQPLEAVPFYDANRKGEIYPPADHPLVVTVGDTANASSFGSTLDHRRKPDVILAETRATFTNGLTTVGASNAAAYFAGIVLVLKAADERLTARHLLAWVHATANSTVRTTARPEVTRAGNLVIRPAPGSSGGTTPAALQVNWRTPSRQELAQRLKGATVPVPGLEPTTTRPKTDQPP
jgi:hypothetical protein